MNHRLLPRDQARIDPFDRGFLFADGVYEGLRAFSGHVVGMPLHVRRLAAGLRELRIDFDAGLMVERTRELLEANRLRDAFIYWQVTRGVPAPGQPVRARLLTGPVTPTLFGYAVPAPSLEQCAIVPTKSACRVRDTRWLRGLVKSIGLVGSVVGAIEAHEQGGDDAILIRHPEPEGEPSRAPARVAEATSSNLLAVLESGEIVTPALESAPILAGVTRDILIAAARAHGLDLRERTLLDRELGRAREIMLLGTLTMVTSVTTLDGAPVGTGTPAPIEQKLNALLLSAIAERSHGA
ncbi:MAG: aminotransferase class IV [Planctomycetota bacterium]|nr:aminotransferase class IV [Planctomycetota bacterium]